MNEIQTLFGTASPEEMDNLDGGAKNYSGYPLPCMISCIDAKVEEVARALGLLDIGLERGCYRSERRSENQSSAWQAA